MGDWVRTTRNTLTICAEHGPSPPPLEALHELLRPDRSVRAGQEATEGGRCAVMGEFPDARRESAAEPLVLRGQPRAVGRRHLIPADAPLLLLEPVVPAAAAGGEEHVKPELVTAPNDQTLPAGCGVHVAAEGYGAAYREPVHGQHEGLFGEIASQRVHGHARGVGDGEVHRIPGQAWPENPVEGGAHQHAALAGEAPRTRQHGIAPGLHAGGTRDATIATEHGDAAEADVVGGDTVAREQTNALEHPELARPVALTSQSSQVPPSRIVHPDLLVAEACDYDPAIAGAQRLL
jgi:hypothetical protein